MPPIQPQPIGNVCEEWDYTAKQCATSVPVLQLPGTLASYFVAKMAIDADGAPKAYNPADPKKPSNTTLAFDWLENLSPDDNHGIQGPGTVAPGFVVSSTALTNPDFTETDTHCYVDASAIPYVVLTGSSFPVPAGTALTKGCLVFVADTLTGNYSGAIYGDAGRAVGEASPALALMLDINPFNKLLWPKVTGGVDDLRIIYIVFPKVVIPPPWNVGDIQHQAWTAFQQWGGEAQLKQLFPHMPKMSGPRPVVITPPVAAAHADKLDAVIDKFGPRLKGGDVPKSYFDGA